MFVRMSCVRLCVHFVSIVYCKCSIYEYPPDTEETNNNIDITSY